MFETKIRFCIANVINGHVTCSFAIMNRKWVIGEHFYAEMYQLNFVVISFTFFGGKFQYINISLW